MSRGSPMTGRSHPLALFLVTPSPPRPCAVQHHLPVPLARQPRLQRAGARHHACGLHLPQLHGHRQLCPGACVCPLPYPQAGRVTHAHTIPTAVEHPTLSSPVTFLPHLQDCANSRLYGGVSFQKAIDDSVRLCSGIGTRVVQKVIAMREGTWVEPASTAGTA